MGTWEQDPNRPQAGGPRGCSRNPETRSRGERPAGPQAGGAAPHGPRGRGFALCLGESVTARSSVSPSGNQEGWKYRGCCEDERGDGPTWSLVSGAVGAG